MLVERGQIGRQTLGQHREDHARGVHRRRVQRRMTIDRRSFRHRRIHVGDRDQHLDVTRWKRLRHRELVEITRIIVVDRAPQQRSQVADRFFGGGRRALDRARLHQRVLRDGGLEAAFAHRLYGDGSEVGALRLISHGS
jgi:hypothetical protein